MTQEQFTWTWGVRIQGLLGKIKGGFLSPTTCAGSEGLNLIHVRHEIAAENDVKFQRSQRMGRLISLRHHRMSPRVRIGWNAWPQVIGGYITSKKSPGWEWIGQACLVTARNHSLECSCAKWSLVGQESLLFMQFHSMKQSQMRIFDITSTAQFTVFSPRFCFPQMWADGTNLAHIENDAPQESLMQNEFTIWDL